MAPRARRPWLPLTAAAAVPLLLAAVHARNFLLPAPRWPRCASVERRPSSRSRVRSRASVEEGAQGSVWWMALNSSSREALESEDPSSVMPVFPLSGAYFPFSEMELSIFEPRYRQLYNDILVSGGRRFVVVAPHPEEERLAEVGVVFYLDELTDVSEESGDEVKYICNHRIIERVRLRRILNPGAWKDASTYLRAEVEKFEDVDDLSDEDTKEQQEEVMALLKRLAGRQEEMGGPHFESHISDYANASCAEQGGLWTLADVFAEYFEFLQSEKEQNLDIDIEQVYRKYNLEEDDNVGTAPFDEDVKDASPGGAPMSSYEPSEDDYEYEEVDLMELPSNARSELWRLQEQFEEEASVLNDDLMLFVHQMLQSRSHAARLKIMRRALLQEERRLAARKALQSVMLSIGSTEDE